MLVADSTRYSNSGTTAPQASRRLAPAHHASRRGHVAAPGAQEHGNMHGQPTPIAKQQLALAAAPPSARPAPAPCTRSRPRLELEPRHQVRDTTATCRDSRRRSAGCSSCRRQRPFRPDQRPAPCTRSRPCLKLKRHHQVARPRQHSRTAAANLPAAVRADASADHSSAAARAPPRLELRPHQQVRITDCRGATAVGT